MDVFSRRVLSCRISITLETGFYIEALQEALELCGKADIFSTDQGSQFTSSDYIEVLQRHEISISMDDKGAWCDNVFVERLWRSIKHEEFYLKAYQSVSEMRASIGRYLHFYNTLRAHSAFDRQTPDAAYFGSKEMVMAA